MSCSGFRPYLCGVGTLGVIKRVSCGATQISEIVRPHRIKDIKRGDSVTAVCDICNGCEWTEDARLIEGDAERVIYVVGTDHKAVDCRVVIA